MIEMDTAALFSPWLVVVSLFYEAFPGFLSYRKSFLIDAPILPVVWKANT